MSDNNNAAEIRALKNEYVREWRKKNPDKARAIRERYWQKKLEQRNAAGKIASDPEPGAADE